jgi:putative endonuclease
MKLNSSTYYIYIAECADGTLYTGYTTDVESRVKTHNDGKGAKYTRSRLPVTIVYTEEYRSKSEAIRREIAIKRLRREKKIALITSS